MIDKVLAEMKNGEVGIVETFERDGEEVVVTNTLGALVERTQSVRMIHWICEHEPNRGLRLREGLHYTSDDAFTHVFAAGSVLMITSCQAAAGDPLHSNIAARICVASNCTVIAPSSLIAMRVGVEFARRLNTVISAHSAGPLNVADLWKRVQGTFKHKLPHPASLSAEKCFALWYGIYGNAENLVRN